MDGPSMDRRWNGPCTVFGTRWGPGMGMHDALSVWHRIIPNRMAANVSRTWAFAGRRRFAKNLGCRSRTICFVSKAEAEGSEANLSSRGEGGKGTVSKVRNELVIIEDLDMEIPLGAELEFGGDQTGVLLLRLDYKHSVALMINDRGQPSKGDEVVAKTRFFLLEGGPEYLGRVVGYDGRAQDGKKEVQGSVKVPMLNVQPEVSDRKKIEENLHTGLCGVDALAPIGKGQTMPFIGPKSSGKSQALMDAILSQKESGVFCVYASLGQPESEFISFQERVHEKDAWGNIATVRVSEKSMGKQFLGLCRALCIAESFRDAGKDCLLVADDFTAPVQLWEDAWELCKENMLQADGVEKMIEYEGMMVSEQMALRRQFISMLIQRAAKMSDELGGGSLTFLMAVEGTPASIVTARQGEMAQKGGLSREKILAMESLTDVQRQTLLAAIDKTMKDGATKQGTSHSNKLSTDYIEELKSLSDGQAVFDANRDGPPTQESRILSRESLSRLGNRAYHPAIRAVAASLRLEMNQAFDELEFGDRANPINNRRQVRLQHIDHFLRQKPDDHVSPEEIAVGLIAIQKGYCDDLDSLDVKEYIRNLLDLMQAKCPDMPQAVRNAKMSTSEVEALLVQAMEGGVQGEDARGKLTEFGAVGS